MYDCSGTYGTSVANIQTFYIFAMLYCNNHEIRRIPESFFGSKAKQISESLQWRFFIGTYTLSSQCKALPKILWGPQYIRGRFKECY